MADAIDERLSEGKLDLVPMIDCIMLLLLFFILTTRFVTDEKRIATLLPTTQGPSSSAAVQIPQQINLCVFPAGMEKGLQPSDYLQQMRESQSATPVFASAWLKVGVTRPMVIDATRLTLPPEQAALEVERVHAYVFDQLRSFELPGPPERLHQVPVMIHCFSGLSWKLALVAYDAVRAYEASKSPYPENDTRRQDLRLAREVEFAAPRVRSYAPNELGDELFEIVNMK